MRYSKSQKQMILLGGTLAAIVVLLGVFVFKPPSYTSTPYVPKTVDTVIPKAVLDHPEYRQLRMPVDLPLVVGQKGRDNPFEPY